MAQHSRAKWAELRVGLLAIVALGILGYLIFLISGTGGLFRAKSNIFTFLDDSSDLAEGAPVRLNGFAVGSVRKVVLSGSNDPKRVIKIDMEIENRYMSAIPVDSLAQVSAGNLLGTKFVNITKGRSPQTVSNGAEIRSEELTTIDNFVKQGNTALSALQSIVQKMDAIVGQVQSGNGNIGKFLYDETLYTKAQGLLDEANKLVAALNSNKGTIPRLLNDDTLYNEFQGSIGRVNRLMDGLEHGEGTAGKLLKDDALYNDFRGTMADVRKTIAEARQMLADVNAGKGDVGKFFKSEELHEEIKGTIARLDGLLDKINNGQGTISQLLNNPSLYESLDGTTREMQGFMKDFRKNPKKFLHIKVSIF